MLLSHYNSMNEKLAVSEHGALVGCVLFLNKEEWGRKYKHKVSL
jgi:hypothetical protein